MLSILRTKGNIAKQTHREIAPEGQATGDTSVYNIHFPYAHGEMQISSWVLGVVGIQAL